PKPQCGQEIDEIMGHSVVRRLLGGDVLRQIDVEFDLGWLVSPQSRGCPVTNPAPNVSVDLLSRKPFAPSPVGKLRFSLLMQFGQKPAEVLRGGSGGLAWELEKPGGIADMAEGRGLIRDCSARRIGDELFPEPCLRFRHRRAASRPPGQSTGRSNEV